MERDAAMEYQVQEKELIYALDIGTRSVIGMLGRKVGERIEILAIEKENHARRAMMDGQIEDISQVSKIIMMVTQRLEKQAQRKLVRAYVAAAGRALRTEQGYALKELEEPVEVEEHHIQEIEALAVAQAEEQLHRNQDMDQRVFLVGYTATQMMLDRYPMVNLLGHTGQRIEAKVVATFLPSEVIDSLYAAMRKSDLEVAGLTLEPIAALNAAIPTEIRLLNLALVDIGAGTSDIAICKDGAVVGYTMATVAGDEITEALMRKYLVDYSTAERIKMELGQEEEIVFEDILGLEQRCTPEEVRETIGQASETLVTEIAERISELNHGAPSALFLAGGGSKLADLCPQVARALNMDVKRVAVAGGHFGSNAYSENHHLDDPEYTTPLGIAISAGLGLISDHFRVFLNGEPAKIFRSGGLTVMEFLMMNGYTYRELLGRTGSSVVVYVDGTRVLFYGGPATPAQLQINGETAKPSAPIHTGDQITFVPAADGADAVVTAQDLMNRFSAPAIFFNGTPLEPDSIIETGSHLTLTREGESPEPQRMASSPKGQERQEITPAQGESQEWVPQSQGDGESREGTGAFGTMMIFLNGKPLELPPKEDGNPYYVLDLLDQTDIDFKNLRRPVALKMNGEDCAFQQVVNARDRLDIYFMDE